MKFFEMKANKQYKILLGILPDAEAVINLLQEINKVQSRGEKAKKAREARLYALQAMQLARDGDESAKKAAEIANEEMLIALEDANNEASESGFVFLKDMLKKLFETEYDRAVKIVALFNDTTPEELQDSCDIFEIIDMGISIITHEKILRFFPQLRQLAFTTPSDTLPN